jgi:hypothetical protein
MKALNAYCEWLQDDNTGFSMNVLFYDPNSEFYPLKDSSEWNDWMKPLEISFCTTVADVIDHLRSMKKRPQVAILCVFDQDLVSLLLSKKTLLMDISVILVLPHDNAELLRLGYRLQPRYIDFVGNRKDTLLSILKSMTTVA